MPIKRATRQKERETQDTSRERERGKRRERTVRRKRATCGRLSTLSVHCCRSIVTVTAMSAGAVVPTVEWMSVSSRSSTSSFFRGGAHSASDDVDDVDDEAFDEDAEARSRRAASSRAIWRSSEPARWRVSGSASRSAAQTAKSHSSASHTSVIRGNLSSKMLQSNSIALCVSFSFFFFFFFAFSTLWQRKPLVTTNASQSQMFVLLHLCVLLGVVLPAGAVVRLSAASSITCGSKIKVSWTAVCTCWCEAQFVFIPCDVFLCVCVCFCLSSSCPAALVECDCLCSLWISWAFFGLGLGVVWLVLLLC